MLVILIRHAAASAACFALTKFGTAMAAKRPMTKTQRNEKYPSTKPVVARPEPPSLPPDFFMSDWARCPKMTAGIPTIGPRQSTIEQIPITRLATARPDLSSAWGKAGSGGGCDKAIINPVLPRQFTAGRHLAEGANVSPRTYRRAAAGYAPTS